MMGDGLLCLFFPATPTTSGMWLGWCLVGITPSDSIWGEASSRCNAERTLLTFAQISPKIGPCNWEFDWTSPSPQGIHGSCHYRADGRSLVQPWHGEQQHCNHQNTIRMTIIASTINLSISAFEPTIMAFRCLMFTWKGRSWFGRGKSWGANISIQFSKVGLLLGDGVPTWPDKKD